jgi:hypothetical protein
LFLIIGFATRSFFEYVHHALAEPRYMRRRDVEAELDSRQFVQLAGPGRDRSPRTFLQAHLPLQLWFDARVT